MNLTQVKKEIQTSCQKVSRDSCQVLVLGATKGRRVKGIKQAFDQGLRVIGENWVQEMVEKLPNLPRDLRVDFIGHLQTNKANLAVRHCHLIHSVDSLRLAREIDKQGGKLGKIQDVLIQVNLTGEKSKFGFKMNKGFFQDFEEILRLSNIKVKGLMTIEPYTKNPEEVRVIFRKLRDLRDKLERKYGFSLPELSMGMSDTFKVAVEEGTTIVRLGRAIFGKRR